MAQESIDPAARLKSIIDDLDMRADMLVKALQKGRTGQAIPLKRSKILQLATAWYYTPIKAAETATSQTPAFKQNSLTGTWVAFSYGNDEPTIGNHNVSAVMGIERHTNRAHVLIPREIAERRHPGRDDLRHLAFETTAEAQQAILRWARTKHNYITNYWPDYFKRKENQAGIWREVMIAASEAVGDFSYLCHGENSLLRMSPKGPPGVWVYAKDDEGKTIFEPNGRPRRTLIEGIRIDFFDAHRPYDPRDIYDAYPSITIGVDAITVVLPRERWNGERFDSYGHQQILPCRDIQQAKTLIVEWAKSRQCVTANLAEDFLARPAGQTPLPAADDFDF